MTGFAALLSAAARDRGNISLPMVEDWRQGRTAFGGFSAAIAYLAARGVEEALPPLRSAQIAFVGPVGADIRASAAMLRRGKSSAFVEARVTSDDALALTGTFLFMAARPSPVTLPAPAMEAASAVDDSAPAMLGKSGPAYRVHLEFRHAARPEDRDKPEFLRWVRLKDRAGLDRATELLLIADSLPTPIIPLLNTPTMVSSADWTLHFHDGVAAPADGWWLVGSKAISAAGGVSFQSMGVWDQAGNAALTSSQTVGYYTGS